MICTICTTNLDEVLEYSCNHQLCLECGTRLVFLYKNKQCPLCKITATSISIKNISKIKKSCDKITNAVDASQLIPLIKPRFTKDEAKQMLKIICFDPGIWKKMCGFLEFRCQICENKYNSGYSLKKHYREHNVVVCNECFENRKEFWYEICLYNNDNIKRHKKGQLSEQGFDGHVYCIHCSIYLYDELSARSHCNKEHILCSICDILGKKNSYYNNFKDLEKHYLNYHYCCNDPKCFENKCYAFPYRSELKEHFFTFHKIKVDINKITKGTSCDIPFMNPLYKSESKKANIITLRVNNESLGYKNVNYNKAVKSNESYQNANVQSSNFPISSNPHPLINSSVTGNFLDNISDRIGNLSIGNVQNTNGDSGLPNYLDRKIVSQMKRNNNIRKSVINRYCKDKSEEILERISMYISKSMDINECIESLEALVDQDIILSLLKDIDFDDLQEEVDIFL